MRSPSAKPPKAITRADFDDLTLPELRVAWGQQKGMRLLLQEKCRRWWDGARRTEVWELWEFRPANPPKGGPRCSYAVTTWWRDGWNCDGPYFSRAEGAHYLRLRGCVPGALIPPLMALE